MRIEGKCHCGNVSLVLDWPDEAARMAVRACDCEFCTKHGASWTSHRDAVLIVRIGEADLLSDYTFGTGTAQFRVCARCGGVPVATSAIDARLYAVVNVNTLEGIPTHALVRAPMHFGDEAPTARLDRRKRTWIPDVRIVHG